MGYSGTFKIFLIGVKDHLSYLKILFQVVLYLHFLSTYPRTSSGRSFTRNCWFSHLLRGCGVQNCKISLDKTIHFVILVKEIFTQIKPDGEQGMVTLNKSSFGQNLWLALILRVGRKSLG